MNNIAELMNAMIISNRLETGVAEAAEALCESYGSFNVWFSKEGKNKSSDELLEILDWIEAITEMLNIIVVNERRYECEYLKHNLFHYANELDSFVRFQRNSR